MPTVFFQLLILLTSQNFRSAEEIVQDEDYGDKPASLQQQIDRQTYYLVSVYVTQRSESSKSTAISSWYVSNTIWSIIL